MTKTDIKHQLSPLELLNNDKKKLQKILVKIITLTGVVYGEDKKDVNISDAQQLAHILDLLEIPLIQLKNLAENKNWTK